MCVALLPPQSRVQLWLFIFLIISIFCNQPKIFSKQFNSIVGCVHVKYFNSLSSQIKNFNFYFLRTENNFMDWNSLPMNRFFNNQNCIIICGNWFRKNVQTTYFLGLKNHTKKRVMNEEALRCVMFIPKTCTTINKPQTRKNVHKI